MDNKSHQENTPPRKVLLDECGPCRETAVTALRDRAKQIILRGQRLMALADALDSIEKSATEGCDGDGRHPYIGVGSPAEEALWEMLMSYRN